MCHVNIPLEKHGGCTDVPRFNKRIHICRHVLSVQNIRCSIGQLKSYCVTASCCTLHIKRGLEYHTVSTHKQLCYRQLSYAFFEESGERWKKHQSACLSSHEVHPPSAHVVFMVCQLLPDVLFANGLSMYLFTHKRRCDLEN
jgi:hypothetical protein